MTLIFNDVFSHRPSGDSVSSCGNDKIPPYTPPPMLSPLRLGTGLYHKTPITPSNKTLYRQGKEELVPCHEVEYACINCDSF